MIVPIVIPQTPATCPHCGKPEDIIEVCRHCQYVYRRPDHPVREVIVTVAVIVGGLSVFVFLMMAMLEWLVGHSNKSLLEIIVEGLRWLFSKRVL